MSETEPARSTHSLPTLPAPLRGVVPPLVTPLHPDGTLDGEALATIVERVLRAGAAGLFLLGTTGEFCSLSSETRRAVIRTGCEITRGRVPVIVNVSDTSFDHAADLADYAARCGAAAVAACPPYYLRCTQTDLFRYATKLAQRVELSVFLYNIPQHATLEFEPATVHRLAENPGIAGIKNSNGRLDYVRELVRAKQRRPGFTILAGNEELTLGALEAGVDGSVPGGANLFPELHVQLYQSIRPREADKARRTQELIARIAQQLYTIGPAETSYLRGMKGALAELGLCRPDLAEPLTAFEEPERQELRSRLDTLLRDIAAQ